MSDVWCVYRIIVCVDGKCVCCVCVCVGCKVNNIGHVGAQRIGDGLKSLTLLTELNLYCEWCVWCDILHCCGVLTKCDVFMCGCTDSNIGHVGAQYIGDGLKSLTSLTTLNLCSEWCVWCVYHIGVWLCVCWLKMCVCVIVCGCTDSNIGDVGAQYIGDGLKSLTSLTTLDLSGERCVWCMRVPHWCVCVMCVGMNGWKYREQDWRCRSTIHWWWSQVTHITYNTGFELWVMRGVCGCVCWLYVPHWCVRCVLIECGCVCVCVGCTANKIGDVGAQYIGVGLKSLTSLTKLDLRSEWCVICIPHCWMMWCVFIDGMWCLILCLYRQQHWRHWSTIHWWWSQVTHITYKTEFKRCVCVRMCVD